MDGIPFSAKILKNANEFSPKAIDHMDPFVVQESSHPIDILKQCLRHFIPGNVILDEKSFDAARDELINAQREAPKIQPGYIIQSRSDIDSLCEVIGVVVYFAFHRGEIYSRMKCKTKYLAASDT